MADKCIVVVGSLNFDLVVQVERIPSVGETILGHQFKTHPGGKGANQAAEIGRLGYPVHMIGRVGSDAFGKELLESLEKVGVDTRRVRISPGPSGIAIIEVQQGGQNSIVVAPGANASLSQSDLDEDIPLIRRACRCLRNSRFPFPHWSILHTSASAKAFR